MQVKQLVDDALLMLEQGQGDSPVPEATRLARHCVERLLAISSAGGSDSNGLSGPQKDDRFE